MRNTTSAGRLRSVSAFAFAVAGLVLGHALAYALAVPDPHHRDLVLARTGHGYLPAATQLALILAFAGAAAAAVDGILSRRDATSGRWRTIAARLAIVQVCAFVGQEVVERVATGAPLADLVQEHLLLAGVATQVVVGIAGAALLRWFARTAGRVADVGVVPIAVPRHVPAFALSSASDAGHGRYAERASAQRAPPPR